MSDARSAHRRRSVNNPVPQRHRSPAAWHRNHRERVCKAWWLWFLHPRRQRMRLLAVVLICTSLAGCGAVALPFRATADVARVVPVAGDVVAAPLDATGDAID